MCRPTPCWHRCTPVRLTSMTACQSPAVILAMVAGRVTPALFTSPSTLPWCLAASSIVAAIKSASSTLPTCTEFGSRPISSATERSLSPLRSTRTGVPPSSAMSRAAAAPIPCAAPVTRIVRPLRSIGFFMQVLAVSCCDHAPSRPTIEIAQTFCAGFPPRLWVRPIFGLFCRWRSPARPVSCRYIS